MELPRRDFAVAGLAAALCRTLPALAQPADASASRAHDALAALEAAHGGRLGVAARDTGSGRSLRRRAGERFAMCSTHKFLTAAAILALADEGRIGLDHQVPYTAADLLSYAPVSRRHVGAGFMTVGALCAAAIEWSDNTADNLLLKLIGGPAGWTRYAGSLGDSVSRLDRIEPALNDATPGDPRDTTTPDAMMSDLGTVLLGATLGGASRDRLTTWMLDSMVTGPLLRAGMPHGWRVADKSGAGGHGTRNDIGIILPPGAAPILVAVYYTGSAAPPGARDRVIAETGRIIAESFTAA